MKKVAVVLAFVIMAGNPVPGFYGSVSAESWQPLYETQGGAAYAFTTEGLIRTGDNVQVRIRAVEALTAGKEKVTTIMYDIHCRHRTFRMIEVVEAEEGVLSVCKNPSDDFPIRPDKHPHLEKLHTKVCD